MESNCSVCSSIIQPDDNFCRTCGVGLRTSLETKKMELGLGSGVTAGIFTVTVGALVTLLGYLLGIVPLLAFGLAALILGVLILYILEPGRMPSSLATSITLPAFLNMERLLEELYFDAKGIYIPTSDIGVSPKVFIPLTQNQVTDHPSQEIARRGRFLVKVGEEPGEMGILINAPGSEILSQLERLGVDLLKTNLNDLASKLDEGFQALRIGRNLELRRADHTATVSLELLSLLDLEIKLRTVTPRFFSMIGGPVESALAAAVANATKSYVVIKLTELNASNKKMKINLGLKKMSALDVGDPMIGEQ